MQASLSCTLSYIRKTFFAYIAHMIWTVILDHHCTCLSALFKDVSHIKHVNLIGSTKVSEEKPVHKQRLHTAAVPPLLQSNVEQIRWVFGDNFCQFSIKNMLWVLIRITSQVLMSTHNVCFYGEISLFSNTHLIYSTTTFSIKCTPLWPLD